METYSKTLSLAVFCAALAACGGKSGNTSSTGNASDTSATAIAVPARMHLLNTSMEDIFKHANPLQITENGDLLTQPLAQGDSTPVFKIQSSSDFIDFLEKQKAAKQIRLAAWDMNDALYNEFLDGTPDKPISDNSITQRNILNAKEMLYFKMWFILTLQENSRTPKEAYDKIYGKLNEICNDCIPLIPAQIEKFQQLLKDNPNNFGIFELLSAQQMMSYGI